MKIRNFIFTIALIQPVLNSALSQSVPASSQSVPASSQSVPASSQSVKVNIAPVISSGATKTTTQDASSREVDPNIWFLFDDSGSMQEFVYYDPTATYILPTGLRGNPMPLIKDIDKYIFRPFIDHVAGWPMDIQPLKLISINTPPYQSLFPQCPKNVKDKKNCMVWQSYYSTRLLTLKSSLANTFLKDNPSVEESQVRVGYSKQRATAEDFQKVYSNLFPVKSIANNQTERLAMKKWLYSIHAVGHTPTRGAMANLYAEIYNNAHAPVTAGAKTNNIFIDDPDQPYDSKNNALLACRRNYVVLLSDGAWNGPITRNTITNEVLTNAGFPQTGKIATDHLVTTEDNTTLPDGNQYSPIAPYKKQIYSVTGFDVSPIRTLGDMAFLGWITDLDN
ncbi:MAG: hypothetical protein ACWIPH_03480, partial [Ostreibacterium sp.]